MSVTTKCYPYGMYGENTYLISDESSGFKAVIDPGYYSDAIENEIGDKSNLKYILLTHGHDDHYSELETYRRLYPDSLYAAPEKEQRLLGNCPAPDIMLNDGDIIKLGETEIKIIATPGHTAGGICFATDKQIYTGDTLFQMSVGRTDLPTGDWNTLVNSIKEKLYVLDEDLLVYPGHGPTTTIGFEKKANPFV